MKTKHIVAIIACTFALGVANANAKDVSGPAIDFTLESNKQKNIRLSDLKGQVVMLNFWASWCKPCRQEMPLLDDIYKKHKDSGFTLLGVNVEEDSKMADKTLKKIPVSFPILYDKTNTVTEQYKVSAMPSSVLIDCDGNVKYVHKGYKKGEEKIYEKMVVDLLKQCRKN